MLIFIYGDDTFRVQEKVSQMRKAFSEKYDQSGMNLDVFPEEGKAKLEVGKVLQSVCSFPFLGEKRMVIVKDLISSVQKGDVKTWEEGLLRSPDTTIVILAETMEPKSLEKKPLYKKLREHSEVHFYPFQELKGQELVNWAGQRVGACGGSIEFDALQSLIERVGADLWQMSAEIEKLVSYAGDGAITKEMVDELVHASFEGQIFALVDAVSKKQSKVALRLLREERWSGANDFYLVSMLSRQVRLLLGARSVLDQNPHANKQDVADATGVHPFVAMKALAQAKSFTLDQLIGVHDLLFRFDHMIKTGQINADLAVDLTAVKFFE